MKREETMKRLSIVFALVVAALCVPLFTACAGGQKGTKYTIDAVYDLSLIHI